MIVCTPGHPRSKGKVKSAVGYVRKNFLPRKRSGDSLGSWQRDAKQWLDEISNAKVHRTTGEIPKERFKQEITSLIPLNQCLPYILVDSLERKVTSDGYISYQNKRYFVPHSYTKQQVRVRPKGKEMLDVWVGEKCIARHWIPKDPKKRVIFDTAHFPQYQQTELLQRKLDNRLAASPHVQQTPSEITRPLEYYESIL